MDLRKIKKLIEMVEASGISELEVRTGDELIRIARPFTPTNTSVAPQRYVDNETEPARTTSTTVFTSSELSCPFARKMDRNCPKARSA